MTRSDSTTCTDRAENVGRAYFFPLSFNEEQAEIIDMIERDEIEVASVTGPPGTGKTHSIANIISHAMATNKRVLVTARTPEAISAVREKLPKALQNLVIASVGTDSESAKQLEGAIQELSDEVVGLDRKEVRGRIGRLESEIVRCDDISREADTALAEVARANLAPITLAGKTCTAMELVDVLKAGEPAHGWFTDRPNSEPPAYLEEVLERLRAKLPRLAPDIGYIGVELPAIEALPSTEKILKGHATVKAHAEREVPDYSNVPVMARDSAETEDSARAVLARFRP